MVGRDAIGQMCSLLLFTAFTVSCGPVSEPRSVQQPTLETVVAKETAGQGWGADVPHGFLRPCVTLSASGGLVELSCDAYQLVEFRKPRPTAEPGDEVPPPEGIGALLEILQARFGPFVETRGEATIDSQTIEISDFVPENSSEPGARGLAVHIGNVEGHFWGLACYRKDGKDVNRSYCTDAIATAARAGGLAHVGALPLKGFGDGKLVAPEGCESVRGRKIQCARGSLSWSVGDAEAIREKTVSDLAAMALAEKVGFAVEKRDCTLFGKEANCQVVKIENPVDGSKMNFVLLLGGEQERLVVCTTPETLGEVLPPPCDQAMTLPGR